MRYPLASIGIVFVIVLAQGAYMFVPVFLRRLVDALSTLTPSTQSLGQFMFVYVLPIALLRVGCWMLYRVSGFIASSLQPRIIMDMLERGFRAVFDQSYRFFSDSFTGTLVRRVQSMANGFRDVAELLWWNLVPMFVATFVAVILLGWRSPLFATVMLVWIVVILIGQVAISRLKLALDSEKAKRYSDIIGALADAITNSFNISLFSSRPFEEKRFGDRVETWTRLQTKSWRIGEAGSVFQNWMNFACELLMMALVIHFWLQGRMTIGDIVFVQALLLTVFDNTFNLARTIRRVYETGSDTYEMLDIFDMVPEIRDRRGAKTLNVNKGSIEFDHVAFAYREERDILKDFSLSIPSKQKIALVGASGSGKTTVTKLLFRFFDIQSGSVKIDGQDISKITQVSLRDSIAHVPQESILFHRSLMENIRYGRRKASDKEVIEAAKLAHCHEFIMASPDGYETLVGERGVKLSGGERQRVAIARAILKDAPILVLDEATSSLDSESEMLIQDALKRLMRNKTVIVIAHRLSTIMEMDRIIVMQEGKIVDEGTHDSLRAKVGIYQKLWNIQAGGFQDET